MNKETSKNLNKTVIIAEVARQYGLQPEKLKMRTRKRHICEPRMVAIRIMKMKTKLSNRQIGLIFKCDHSTVSYARKKIGILYEVDKDVKKQMDAILNELNVELT